MARHCLYPRCAGAFLATGLVAYALMASPALAEVCDKIAGEGWRREDGPGGLSIVPRALLFFALIGIAAVAKRWWLSWTLFGVTGLVTAVGWFDDGDDAITQAGIHEGCLAPSHWTSDILVILFAVALGWIAVRQSLSNNLRTKT